MNHNANIQLDRHTRTEMTKKEYGRGVLAILGVTVAIIAAGTYEKIHSRTPEGTKMYIVKPGDSEWGIARRTWPNDLDPRAHVYELDKQLPDDAQHVGQEIQAGDRFELPAGSPIFKSDKTS